MPTAHLTHDDYAKILSECIQAWNRGDADAVASFYTDDLDYRDPSVPKGIRTKKDFVDYLRLMFSVWPEQQWLADKTYIHIDEAACTATYRFRIANDKVDITGIGADLIEFRGDKIHTNYVYLNADKWNSWLKKELAQYSE